MNYTVGYVKVLFYPNSVCEKCKSVTPEQQYKKCCESILNPRNQQLCLKLNFPVCLQRVV